MAQPAPMSDCQPPTFSGREQSQVPVGPPGGDEPVAVTRIISDFGSARSRRLTVPLHGCPPPTATTTSTATRTTSQGCIHKSPSTSSNTATASPNSAAPRHGAHLLELGLIRKADFSTPRRRSMRPSLSPSHCWGRLRCLEEFAGLGGSGVARVGLERCGSGWG